MTLKKYIKYAIVYYDRIEKKLLVIPNKKTRINYSKRKVKEE